MVIGNIRWLGLGHGLSRIRLRTQPARSLLARGLLYLNFRRTPIAILRLVTPEAEARLRSGPQGRPLLRLGSLVLGWLRRKRRELLRVRGLLRLGHLCDLFSWVCRGRYGFVFGDVDVDVGVVLVVEYGEAVCGTSVNSSNYQINNKL